ncbi:hypothetical protein KCH_62500 [Kitasatospora cheerisanensis KCTC 2395]|uniref:Uncharacterized protein n=1 Tax=Kitasatospora cheerisanensis KCTC 2395 TaxID=1348663 RepID=A0A066YKC8_9ACTN|nr:hypothetical protein KCH_62500 [Kitasatospora cheerisanensis KCTC 2395]
MAAAGCRHGRVPDTGGERDRVGHRAVSGGVDRGRSRGRADDGGRRGPPAVREFGDRIGGGRAAGRRSRRGVPATAALTAGRARRPRRPLDLRRGGGLARGPVGARGRPAGGTATSGPVLGVPLRPGRCRAHPPPSGGPPDRSGSGLRLAGVGADGRRRPGGRAGGRTSYNFV